MNSVDHLADVGLLKSLDPGIERKNLVVEDRGDSDVIDVVGRVERVTLNVVGGVSQVQAETFEEHDRCIDAVTSGCDDPFAKSIEVGLIEDRQIEREFAVLG